MGQRESDLQERERAPRIGFCAGGASKGVSELGKGARISSITNEEQEEAAEYKLLKKAIMVFFFSVTTPFGVALGNALSKTYKENSPIALIIVGLLNASSAGVLIYMALVDLLSADLMAPKLQASIKLQIKCFLAVLLGAGGMSLVAKWA
ncbi:probable zinc transporter 10 [Quercus suber]|uniref:probable zinc transporter 10 n=1 Tax=Quercus suber TaxID=58331 RepID=UPI0032DE8AA4